MQIGFIGVGAMGGGLARNLIRAGKSVLIYDINAAMVEKTLAAGTTGKAVQNAADLAGCDLVFTSLPLPTHLQATMLGDAGLLAKMSPGAIYIDVSTIDPGTARELEAAAKEKGIPVVINDIGGGGTDYDVIVISDNYNVGVMAAEEMDRLIADTIKLAIPVPASPAPRNTIF